MHIREGSSVSSTKYDSTTILRSSWTSFDFIVYFRLKDVTFVCCFIFFLWLNRNSKLFFLYVHCIDSPWVVIKVQTRIINSSDNVKFIITPDINSNASTSWDNRNPYILLPFQALHYIDSFLRIIVYSKHNMGMRRWVLKAQYFMFYFLISVPLLRPKQIQFIFGKAMAIINMCDLSLRTKNNLSKTIFQFVMNLFHANETSSFWYFSLQNGMPFIEVSVVDNKYPWFLLIHNNLRISLEKYLLSFNLAQAESIASKTSTSLLLLASIYSSIMVAL